MLTIAQLTAYIQAATMLVEFGGATVAQVRAMFGATQHLTPEQLNVIIDMVEQEARRRKALADAESGRNPT